MPKLNVANKSVEEKEVESTPVNEMETNIYIFENQGNGPKARVNFRNPLFGYTQATIWSKADGSYQTSNPLVRNQKGEYVKKKDGNYVEVYSMPEELKQAIVDKYLETEKTEQASLKDVTPSKDDIKVHVFLRLKDGEPVNGVLANIEIEYKGIKHSQISVMQSREDPEDYNVKYPIVRNANGEYIIGKDGYPLYYFSPASKVARDLLDEAIMTAVQEAIDKTLTE